MPAPTGRIDPNLLEFCTEAQRKLLQSCMEHGSLRKGAAVLGLSKNSATYTLRAVERKAAIQGYSPQHDLRHVVAPGFMAKGHSTLYDGNNKPVLQWVKTTRDAAAQELIIRESIDAMMQVVPRELPKPLQVAAPGHLCNVVTLTDVHVGAYAWGRETGADWDLTIAEATVVSAVQHLVDNCPRAQTGVLAQLGDFLHQDGLAAVTPTSGHHLDADSRFSKVVQVAVRVLRECVRLMLSRHDQVILLVAEGNHDIASSVWLRRMFTLLFEAEPRVKVIDSELPYYCHQHGKTMLGWHHGHLKKPDQLPLLFAAQFPAVWGSCTRRYIHTGHLHHKHEREHNGVTTIQHPTIAARDAYAARGGWIADRELTAITYSADFGQVARTTVSPEMLAAA